MGKQSERRKTSAGTIAEAATRPPIWTEGRQRPRFDLAAFASVATAITKRDLHPAIDGVAVQLATLGARVHCGDLRITARWAQPVLPPHQWVGATVLALQRCLVAAQALITQPGQLDLPLAYPDLGPRADRPKSVPKPKQPASVELTLHAIRSAIAFTPHDAAQDRHNPTVREHHAQGYGSSGCIQSALARTLLALMMLVALPAGAVKALLYHLNGGDLRDWS